jgi:hypothetical protein
MTSETALLAAILIVLVAAIWRAERRHTDAMDVAHFCAEELGEVTAMLRDMQEADDAA